MNASLIVILVVVALVAALCFAYRRQLMQILSRAKTLVPEKPLSEQLDQHLEKQRLNVEKLEATMHQEESEIVRLDGMVENQKQNLKRLANAVKEAKARYADGRSARPKDEPYLNGLALAVAAAQKAYEGHRTLVNQFLEEAAEAHAALAETIRILEERKAVLTRNEVKVALAKAIELRNAAYAHFESFKQEAAILDEATSAIDRGLAEARARRKVNSAASEDQELERRQRERDAEQLRAKLDAELDSQG